MCVCVYVQDVCAWFSVNVVQVASMGGFYRVVASRHGVFIITSATMKGGLHARFLVRSLNPLNLVSVQQVAMFTS